jgi:hypothetical protein
VPSKSDEADMEKSAEWVDPSAQESDILGYISENYDARMVQSARVLQGDAGGTRNERTLVEIRLECGST